MSEHKIPHPLVASIPVVVLIGLLIVVITLFGSDALSGGSQIALLLGLAVCVTISMVFYHVPWKTFERQMCKTIGDIAVTLLILLTVGMLAGSWMISGVVPTLIYYGVQILSPKFFLVSACVICALVSLLSGSSWTSSLAGHRPCLGHQRGMDGGCHHFGGLLRRQDVTLERHHHPGFVVGGCGHL